MARKNIRRFAVLLTLGVAWQVTSAEPAKAVFQAFNILSNDQTLTDALGRSFRGPFSDGCPYYLDPSNIKWRLWSPIYYFRSNKDNNSNPLVFGTLRNESDGTIWDGGFGNGAATSASSIGNYLPSFTVVNSCAPTKAGVRGSGR